MKQPDGAILPRDVPGDLKLAREQMRRDLRILTLLGGAAGRGNYVETLIRLSKGALQKLH